jgi:transposase
VFRAKLILMLAEGASFNAIKRQLQTTAPTIVRWKQRFRQYGLEGLDTYHPGQKPSVLTPALRARILSATRRKPSDGSTLRQHPGKLLPILPPQLDMHPMVTLHVSTMRPFPSLEK